jgi:predicted dehydrogenase
MRFSSRRSFLKSSVLAALPVAALNRSGLAKSSPNETVNVAVMGIRGQGAYHLKNYPKVPNVNVAAICDIDERLFPKTLAGIEAAGGRKPKTYTDIRRMLEDKDIDAISIAVPNHWHALATIWACQAGKDVYVEKPACYALEEGRRMVQVASKHQRVVQVGTHHRSRPTMRSAVEYLHSGKLGKIYMIKCVCFRPREDIGRKPDSSPPAEVHYDLFRGPAPMIPFNENRFHYNWHWFWDTGNGETGNNGPHMVDMARHILKKREHPKRIMSMGGVDVYAGTQETPNSQLSSMEYADGTRVQLEVRGLYTNAEDKITMGLLVYGSEGWMHMGFDEWATYFGRKNEPGEHCSEPEANARSDEFQKFGNDGPIHYANFIDAVRSRTLTNLHTTVEEGHWSAAMCHLSNIAYRTGRTLVFDSDREKFVNDKEADGLLTREYRAPFVVPDKV